MYIKLIFLLFITLNVLHATTYTYSFCTTSTIQNAQNCVKKYVKNPEANFFIIHDIDGKYRTTYGNFKTYEEAKAFKKFLPKKIIALNPFIKRYDYSFTTSKQGLTNTSKIINLIDLQKTKAAVENVSSETKNKVINSTQRIIKQNIIDESKSIIKDNQTEIDNNLMLYSDNTNKKQIIDNNCVSIDCYTQENVLTENNHTVLFDNDSKNIQTNDNINKSSIFNLELTIGYLLEDIQGDIQYANGSKFNFEKDFGISKSQSVIFPKILISYDQHELFLSYLASNYESFNTLTSDYVLNNYTFIQNQPIKTKIELQWFESGYRYNIYNALVGFNIIKYIKNLQVSNNLNLTEIESSYTIPTANIDMLQKFNKLNISYGVGIGNTNKISYCEYYLGFQIDKLYFKETMFDIGFINKQLTINDNLYKNNSQYSNIYLKFRKRF